MVNLNLTQERYPDVVFRKTRALILTKRGAGRAFSGYAPFPSFWKVLKTPLIRLFLSISSATPSSVYYI